MIGPASDKGDVACAHCGRNKLAFKIDAVLDLVVGRAGDFAVGRTKKADPLD